MLAMVGVVVGAVLGLGVAAYLVALYSSLVEVRSNVGRAWKNVDVLLQQRHDELPSLIDAAKVSLGDASGLLERITRLRTGYDLAFTIDGKARVENELNREVERLRHAWEACPDFGASAAFAQGMARISALESSIADRREAFNDSVNDYNVRTESFPDLVLARVMGCTRHAFLEAPVDRTEDACFPLMRQAAPVAVRATSPTTRTRVRSELPGR